MCDILQPSFSLLFYVQFPLLLSTWLLLLWYACGTALLPCTLFTPPLVPFSQEPRALDIFNPPADTTVPSIIACASTGFFAFQLWTCVDNRLFGRNLFAILHYTILLVLFGVGAFKNVHVAFLTVTLVSEVSTVFYVIGKMQVRSELRVVGLCIVSYPIISAMN